MYLLNIVLNVTSEDAGVSICLCKSWRKRTSFTLGSLLCISLTCLVDGEQSKEPQVMFDKGTCSCTIQLVCENKITEMMSCLYYFRRFQCCIPNLLHHNELVVEILEETNN